MAHPAEETLKRFAAGTASRQESRAVVAHLLKGCTLCATRLRALMEPRSVAGVSYDTTLDRFDRVVLNALENTLEESVEPPPMLPGGAPSGDRLAPRRRNEK